MLVLSPQYPAQYTAEKNEKHSIQSHSRTDIPKLFALHFGIGEHVNTCSSDTEQEPIENFSIALKHASPLRKQCVFHKPWHRTCLRLSLDKQAKNGSTRTRSNLLPSCAAVQEFFVLASEKPHRRVLTRSRPQTEQSCPSVGLPSVSRLAHPMSHG